MTDTLPMPVPIRLFTSDKTRFGTPQALKTAQSVSYDTLQDGVACSGASTRTGSPHSSCSRSPSPEESGDNCSQTSRVLQKGDDILTAGDDAYNSDELLKKCLEIDALLKEAEALAVQWKTNDKNVVSKMRDWPELSPEGLGYTFTQDICQVTNGSIKLAENKVQGSFQCVKCFEKAKMQKDALEQMRDEVELMFALGAHRNIGEALEVFQDSISYYVVQPYYAGGNLVNLNARAIGAGVVPIEEWWTSIARQCLKGIAHMHTLDVMHCDIKEQNIMIRGEDLWEPEVVIIDLGVAQRGSTQRTIIYGTPGYIPPEVWETKNWYPQSDMFSLGVVVLQMLIGKMGIFTDNTTTFKEVEEATRCRTPPFELMPAEYPSLKCLAQKLLAKEFQSRPSAARLLQEPWEDMQAGNSEKQAVSKLPRRLSPAAAAGVETSPAAGILSGCRSSVRVAAAPSSMPATPRRPVAAGFAQKLFSHRRVRSF